MMIEKREQRCVGNEVRGTINSREWISNLGAQPAAAKVFNSRWRGMGLREGSARTPTLQLPIK